MKNHTICKKSTIYSKNAPKNPGSVRKADAHWWVSIRQLDIPYHPQVSGFSDRNYVGIIEALITPYQSSKNGSSFQMRFLLRVHCVTRVQRTHHMMFVRSLVRRFHSSFHDQVSQWVSVSQKWTHCVFTENCAYQEFRNMYLVNV